MSRRITLSESTWRLLVTIANRRGWSAEQTVLLALARLAELEDLKKAGLLEE
jgi:lipocalin